MHFRFYLQITGVEPPHPVTSFSHFGFDEALMKGIRKVEYSQPTPIQAAGIPVALSGRDLIGWLSWSYVYDDVFVYYNVLFFV